MNIFTNPDENRLRAGWRLAAQFFLMFLIGFGLIWLISRFYNISGEFIPTLAIATGAIISTILAARGMDLRPWAAYGLTFSSEIFREHLFGFFLGGLVMGIIFVIEYAAGWLTFTGFGWQQSHHGPYLLSFGGYFLWMIIVGIYEELIFRGYQIVNLGEGLNLHAVSRSQAVLGAVALSSLIFGIMHATNPNAGLISTIYVALAGVMLAFPFIITGRLALSVGAHIGWNFFQGGVFGFSVSGLPSHASLLQMKQGGPELITGGGFGPEAGLIGLLGLTFMMIGLTVYLKRANQPLAIHSKFGTYSPSPRHYPA